MDGRKKETPNLHDLQQCADDPYWDDEEIHHTAGLCYPFPADGSIEAASERIAASLLKENIFQIGSFWADQSPQSHVGPFKHAIDFLVPDGTEVLAALDGEIVEIVEKFDKWGPTAEYAPFLNYITVRCAPNEYVQYCHLAKGSVTKAGLKVGDRVAQGQKIATVGRTGWTDADHLHIMAFRRDENKANSWGFKSLKIRFA